MQASVTNHRAILSGLFLEAINDWLSLNAIGSGLVKELDTGTDPRHIPNYVSVLGATGEGLALSSTMTVDRELLVNTHPLGPTDILPADLDDWCRELNNQLVGRLKNKLLSRGVVVMLGLPVLIRGTDVTTVGSPDLTVTQHVVRTANGRLSFHLSTLIDENLTIPEQSCASEEVLLEGAVALF
jgi:hypothetical protein